MRRSLLLIVISCLTVTSIFLAIPGGQSRAASPPPIVHGLLITPIRRFITQKAGAVQQGSFTVANLTSGDITVDLSVKQFNVSNYDYNYEFDTPDNNWVSVGLPSVTLKPNESKDIPYTIDVPAGTAGGGHYYTFFASANLQNGGLKSAVQATLLVYLTVQGKLRETSVLQSASYQRIAFGRQAAYTLVARNTGNVHYFVYTSGHLHGLFTGQAPPVQAHLLLPASTRIVSGAVTMPILPGLYHLNYGYRTDGGTVITKAGYVLYIPPWFICLLLGVGLVGRIIWRKRRARTKPAA